MDWKEFWDRPNSIYVNERHRRVHYRLIADELIGLAGDKRPSLLDHGCGEALEADRVLAACGRLCLLDAAPSVRDKLKTRFPAPSPVVILSPDELEGLDDASLDLVVANSLLQYLSAADLDACLTLWRRKLKADGRLVLADIVTPEASALADVMALLRLAAANGFLLAALLGLVRTALSPYARLRKELGLSKHAEGDIIARLRRFGFDGKLQGRNLGHNQARMTIIATPTSPLGE